MRRAFWNLASTDTDGAPMTSDTPPASDGASPYTCRALTRTPRGSDTPQAAGPQVRRRIGPASSKDEIGSAWR